MFVEIQALQSLCYMFIYIRRKIKLLVSCILYLVSLILARENTIFVWPLIGRAATGFYMNHQFVRVTSLALANTNIQYKQINYDADNIDNNK